MLPRRTDTPLRRRRAAALRLPPLADGIHDPLDHYTDHYWKPEERRRELCNTLAAMGFNLDYLQHRYGIRPRPRTQHCPCCRHHHQEAAA